MLLRSFDIPYHTYANSYQFVVRCVWFKAYLNICHLVYLISAL